MTSHGTGRIERRSAARPVALVVEPHETAGEELCIALQAIGWTTVRASTAAAAMSAAFLRPPRLVLLALDLPDTSGYALCSYLRARNPDAAVVVLAADEAALDTAAALTSGADDCVAKPYRLSDLMARVRQQLQRIAQHRSSSDTTSWPLSNIPSSF